MPFALVNLVVGVLFVAMAWLRGLRPGLGTIVQPVVVGFTVSGVLAAVDPPSPMLGRTVLLLCALPLLAAGVALYLDSALGAGPTEAAALAWDPPVPFRCGATACCRAAGQSWAGCWAPRSVRERSR